MHFEQHTLLQENLSASNFRGRGQKTAKLKGREKRIVSLTEKLKCQTK